MRIWYFIGEVNSSFFNFKAHEKTYFLNYARSFFVLREVSPLFPLLIILLIAIAFSGIADLPAVQGALRGMGAVAAGLITATGIKLARTWKQNVMGVPVCIGIAAAAYISVAFLRMRLIWVILVLGGAGCAWAYRQLNKLPPS